MDPEKMGVLWAGEVREAAPVVLEWERVRDPGSDLGAEVRRAFGPDGLGILAVSGVPGVLERRQALLPLASRLTELPEERRQKLEDPASSWSFGWSHGRETLEGGVPDVYKGSFYANPQYDRPTEDAALMAAFPSYCRPNVWSEDLPELGPAFKAMGQLIVDVGAALAVHCDKYVSQQVGRPSTQLHDTIRRSRTCKGRLLHYFPPGEAETAEARAANPKRWCGWHLDHGSLTGLTSAMYENAAKEAVPNPDPACGLYIEDRQGAIHHVKYAADQLAYQIGESSQIMSGGCLRATPHSVTTASGPAARGICRNTFAVFMQPMWDQVLDPEFGVAAAAKEGEADGTLMGLQRPERYGPGINFGKFTERTLAGYY